MNRTQRALAVGALILVSGCGQGDLPLDSVDPAAAPLAPTYDDVVAILHRSCFPCHDEGSTAEEANRPNLATCEGLLEHLDHTWETIADGTMPTGAWPRLSESEKLLIRRWIEGGACAPCGGTCP